MRLYCRKIAVNNKTVLHSKGPLLIACNHPNSFLDAIVIATLFDKPVYSLTRGDTFRKRFYARLLDSLNMIPVYRMSEGAENLEKNYEAFDKCRQIFKQKGIVLIFSEGGCINEWKLRPLKKGTARLALSSWQENLRLTIIPAAINYQSFRSFGKNIQLNFGKAINKEDIDMSNGFGNAINEFNDQLRQELKKITIEIKSNDKISIRNKFEVKITVLKKVALFLPALAGALLHAPLYLPVQQLSWYKARHVDHYDAVIVGLLFVLYPLYLVLTAILFYLLFGGYWWTLVFLLMPVTAWSFVQVKKQF